MKLSDYDYNVIEFNAAMKDLTMHLKATKDKMGDKPTKHSLIRAYNDAKNDTFKRYIEQMVNFGSLPGLTDIMLKGERKYKQLVN